MDMQTVFESQTQKINADQFAIYKAIYEAISDAVIFVDIDRQIELMNDAAVQLFGYTLNEVKGKKTQIFYANPEEYGIQGKKRYSKSGASKSNAYEIEYKKKDGTLFIGETLGSHVHDAAGELIGYIGVVRDVTQRNQAFKLVERFGRIIEDSLNEVYLFDDETLYFIDVNRGARQNMGYDIEELRSMTPYDIKPELSKVEFEQLISPLKDRTKDILHFETVHQRKDGSTYPVEVHLQLVRLEEDFFFLALISDITERKKADEELHAHREHLEQLIAKRSAVLKEQSQIINQIHDSVVTTDLKGVVTSWNNGATKLFGFTSDEMLGKHISELYPAEEHKFLADSVVKPLIEKGEHEVEVRMRKKNKSDFYAHLSLSKLYDEAGNPKGMVGYSIDITARKKAEEAARRHANELALANEELGRFNYSVSHDLKSPLRAIDGFSAAILDDYQELLDEQGKDYLNRIRNATQRMGRLIEDMLKLSRVSLEEIHLESIDLSKISTEVIALLKERSETRNVTARIQPSISVDADEGLMHILMENLLDNAWKYTSKNEDALIEFSETTNEGKRVICIKDNGVGFDAQYANQLFDPFQRLHSNEEFAGTGIGLATVQTIVNRHHWQIWAESRPNEGATFCICIPK